MKTNTQEKEKNEELQLVDESRIAEYKAMGGKLIFKIGNCQPTEDIKEANTQLNEMVKEIKQLREDVAAGGN